MEGPWHGLQNAIPRKELRMILILHGDGYRHAQIHLNFELIISTTPLQEEAYRVDELVAEFVRRPRRRDRCCIRFYRGLRRHVADDSVMRGSHRA